MNIYSRYNVPGGLPHHFTEPSQTQQHFKEECDINNIISRMVKTGFLPQIDASFDFTDVSDVNTFEQSMTLIAQTTQAFDMLPADIRKKFDNNASNLLDFVANPDNASEAVSLGLLPALLKDASLELNPQETAPESSQETAPEARPATGRRKTRAPSSLTSPLLDVTGLTDTKLDFLPGLVS